MVVFFFFFPFLNSCRIFTLLFTKGKRSEKCIILGAREGQEQYLAGMPIEHSSRSTLPVYKSLFAFGACFLKVLANKHMEKKKKKRDILRPHYSPRPECTKSISMEMCEE